MLWLKLHISTVDTDATIYLIKEATANIGNKYVLSLKLNPAILAAENWNSDVAGQELEEALKKTNGCAAEVIMKDISTCRRQPHRLYE